VTATYPDLFATVRTAKQPCAVPDCPETATSRGWCGKHYARWKKHGDPLTVTRTRRPSERSAIDLWRATGTVAVTGDPLGPVRVANKPCSVSDCPDKAMSRGMCAYHFQQWQRSSEPAWTVQNFEPGVTCSIRGCESRALSRGWCGSHYYRWKKYGTPLAPVRRRTPAAEHPVPDRGPARYGLTVADLEAMWTAQRGLCRVCSVPLHRTGMSSCNIDHCHETGRVRGLLCRACNRGIGLLGDDPLRLELAARYLRAA
jgi:hypothetical protein